MYLVGALIETKGAHLLQIEVGQNVVGYMPVYKNKTFAKKRAGTKYPVYQIEAVNKELK